MIDRTKATRVAEDLADKLGWIIRLEGGSSAEILDPAIRPLIEQRFERIRPAAEEIKAAEDKHRRIRPVGTHHDIGGES